MCCLWYLETEGSGGERRGAEGRDGFLEVWSWYRIVSSFEQCRPTRLSLSPFPSHPFIPIPFNFFPSPSSFPLDPSRPSPSQNLAPITLFLPFPPRSTPSPPSRPFLHLPSHILSPPRPPPKTPSPSPPTQTPSTTLHSSHQQLAHSPSLGPITHSPVISPESQQLL